MVQTYLESGKRKYPDLSSDDGCYIAPCTDVKYICIDTSGESHPSQKTVDAWIDTIEDEIAKVISSIGSDTGIICLIYSVYLNFTEKY